MRFSYPAGATPLDPNEIEGLIPSSISSQLELNAFEQANILDAERWALARKRRDILSDRFVRELHRRMLNQVWRWAGKYRTTDKNIGEPWAHVPVKVRELCDDARYWIEGKTYVWEELGARFHHRLVSIHPFANGNGRHARLMTDVLMKNHGQDLFSWGTRELGGAGNTRGKYIAALKAADAKDYAPLIRFVTS